MSRAGIKMHNATWVIRGKGKNRSYFAGVPAMTCSPGDRIKMVSKVGVETTGVLVEVAERGQDGIEVWTFNRDAKTPEQRAMDRALKAQAQAAYWASNKGIETAAKIAARSVRKQLAAEIEQANGQASEHVNGQVIDTAGTGDMAAMAAALKAAGYSAAEVVAALKAESVTVDVPANTAETITVAPDPVVNGAKVTRTRKQTTTKAQAKTECLACGKQTAQLHRHVAGHVNGVCDACMLLDGDTVRIRATRRASKAN